MQKVLVIDDNIVVRNTIVKTLESAGYLAVGAGDGNKALRAYASERPDLVITDIIMPDKDGIETIRTLLKHNPQAKIIAISGGARIGDVDLLKLARMIGASETLAKPFDPDDLIQSTRRLLAA
jgi:CheY-like chemotaxis protein